MTDMESNQSDGGAGGLPTPPSSKPSGAVSSPVDVSSLEELRQEIKRLTGEINALKSGKDRGIANVAKKVNQLEELIKQYEGYRSQYQDPDKALREMRIDALLASQEIGEAPADVSVARSGTPAQPTGEDYTALITALGLQVNDSDVMALVASGKSYAETTRELANLALKRKQPQPQPTTPSPLPTGSGSTINVDLEAEYQKEAAKLRRGDVYGQMELLRKYRRKAKEQGLKFTL